MSLLLALVVGFSPPPTFTAVDSIGHPIRGAALCVFQAGSTIPADSFVTPAVIGRSVQPNTNPVMMDGRGQASIYLDPRRAYRLVLLAPGSTFYDCSHLKAAKVIRDVDNIRAYPARRK